MAAGRRKLTAGGHAAAGWAWKMAAGRGGRLIGAKEWLWDVAPRLKGVHRRLRGVARRVRGVDEGGFGLAR